MTQRVNRHRLELDLHPRPAGPTGRCPVQPSTPLGPDQVNAIIIIREIRALCIDEEVRKNILERIWTYVRPVPTPGQRAVFVVQRERAYQFPTTRLTPLLVLVDIRRSWWNSAGPSRINGYLFIYLFIHLYFF
jgi:hypothetical protein